MEPNEFPAQDTVKVPGPVKICVLKLPLVIVAFPPDAATYAGAKAIVVSVDSFIINQP